MLWTTHYLGVTYEQLLRLSAGQCKDQVLNEDGARKNHGPGTKRQGP